ncbi:unnamed protein product [Effrenium voratum]|nr:unnamed protein product [Effrenium voratum]
MLPQHKKPPGLGGVLRFGPMSGLEAFLRLAQLDSALDQAREFCKEMGAVEAKALGLLDG